MSDLSAEQLLEGLNGLDAAAGCAALQLHAPNAEASDWLSSLAATALECGGDKTGREVPWSELLSVAASCHDGPRWDLHETAWVEPLAFYGGEYLFLSAGSPDSVFQLRHVLQAAFLGDGVGSEDLRRRLRVTSRAVLRLSTHLLRAAGAIRYQVAPPRPDAAPRFPGEAHFEELREAVDLSAEPLRRIIGTVPDALAPLIRDVEQDGPPERSPTTGAPRFDLHPILQRGDRYVVAGPADLAVALRHVLISALLGEGLREALTHRLWEVTAGDVMRSGELMDWRTQTIMEPAPGEALGALVFGFDTDKAAVVTVVGDDLDGYDTAQPDAMWNAFPLSDQVEQIMLSVEGQLLYGPPRRPQEILHVALVAGCGRSAMFGMQGPQPPVEAPRILLSSEGLSTIALAGTDQCELWKFARASKRLHEYAQVMPGSPLDAYAAWRTNDRSFYLDDEDRPTFVVFDSSYGSALRERVASERDPHAATTPEGGITEVIRVHDDPGIPIYVPISDLQRGSPTGPRMLVEGGQLPMWVTSSANAEAADRGTYAQLVDCVAYWLWQFSPSVPRLPEGLEEEPVIVEIEVDRPAVWRNQQAPDEQGQVATVGLDLDSPGIQLVVRSAMVVKLDQATNLAERELARTLMEAFAQLATELGQPEVPAETINQAIERHSPLGPKKKINLMRSVTDVALLDGPLPPYRTLQDADAEELLDGVGDHLAERLGLEEGPIAPETQAEVLNRAVEYHYQEFTRLLATVFPDGLLEHLVAAHEAALHQEAISRRTFGARAACFDETKLIEDMRREIPIAANTAIALRFTIEYVVAQPPRGIRPLTFDLLDRILALASQITNRGLSSDIAYYRLDELKLSLLPSGRLGTDRTGGYYAAQQAFLDAAVPIQARAARDRYAGHWEPLADGRPAIADELDRAGEAEWGLTMTELAELHGELVAIADGGTSAFSSSPRAQLIADLVQRLGLEEPRVERGVELLTLGSRNDFLKPPDPFSAADVYPWRFNRELSYVRRPLLLRRNQSSEEIIWGPRHVDAAGRYLFGLVTSERLKARSGAMRTLMSGLRQEETTAFVEQVEAECAQAGMEVRRNVWKVAGTKITKPDGDDAGDIDVLAADAKARVLHVLECKDLEGARTPAELHNELERTFMIGGPRRSATEKHLDRIVWVEQHLAETLAWLGLPGNAESWRVSGAFVVDSELLSPYVYDCPLPVIPISRLLLGLGAASDAT